MSVKRTTKRIKVFRRRIKRLWRKFKPSHSYGTYTVAPLSERKRVVITQWNSDEGRKLLLNAGYKEAFFRIAHNHQPQINPFYCGVACMVTTLNTLRLHKGRVPSQHGFEFEMPDGEPVYYRFYSQLTLLNEQTELIKRKVDIAPTLLPDGTEIDEETFNPGLELNEISAMLETHGVKCMVHFATLPPEHGLPKLKEDLKATLNDAEKVLIANFDGKTMGAATGGHYSLIGAYDEESDCVLVLDTAAHKNPWFWVPAKHLYFAMHQRPKDAPFPRGYIIVTDS